ncbi:MAG: penicillin-binding protein 1A [candidate division NC10 bacterium]|nr:penicillin-binding protein 1A [candidate division NC10 bacterium]
MMCPRRFGLGRLVGLGMLLLIAYPPPCGGALADPDKDLPSLDRLEIFQPGEPSLLYSQKGEPFASLAPEYRIFVPLDRIPRSVREAMLDAEDAQFYQHGGISLKGMARAAIRNLTSARVKEGGSTITQQLAKSLFLSPDRTFSRKVKEFTLAREIEKHFSKDKILEMYLNAIYFGSGAYGIEAAARTYFSKSVGQLSVAEAALLAGLVKAPTTSSPLVDMKKARARRDYVLGRMRTEGHLGEAQAKAAKQQPVALKPLFRARGVAPHFVDYLRSELEARYGRVLTAKGGLRIYTTLDLEIQRQATEALRTGVKAIENTLAGKRKIPAGEPRWLEAALVALDPTTGEIRAMVGGLDYGHSQFNRAVQAKRQPGSAFKPFVYAAAFERGYAPTRLIGDYPVSYTIPRNGRLVEWRPENYDRQFRGSVTLRRALEDSINVPAVRLLEAVGVDAVIDLARRAGIRSELRREYALALGVSEVSLLELAAAYTMFANRGMAQRPVGIRQVVASHGEILESAGHTGEPVLREEVAFILQSVLRGVVERGTARRARLPGWDVAAKTGTSQESTDLWLVGFTPRLLTGLWIGADQPRPLGSHESAGRLAAPIWADFMRRALREESPVTLPIPEGVLPIRVDYRTGDLAAPDDPGGILEYVLRGESLPDEPARGLSAPGPTGPPSVQPSLPLPAGAGER